MAVIPGTRNALQLLLLFMLLALSPFCGARVIVLGFDGMDPKLADEWMAEGILPSFSRLAEEGHYQRLATTNPAQSPVAWASFATGANPGEHGIFDFIRRDRGSYTPDFSISETLAPERHLDLLGYHIPLDDPLVRSRRVGKPFWVSAEQRGEPSSVLRVPVTYPPDRIHRMLAGMGVPDLLGTQGTFTFYTSRYSDLSSTGGRVVRVIPENHRIESRFEGPPHPLAPEKGALSVPLVMERLDGKRVRVTLGGETAELAEGDWSDWIPVSFGFAGVLSVDGMVRLHLVTAFPRPSLYVSPINIDPHNPAVTISSPEEYAAELAARIGPYHTLGMPEETWSLNERRIDDKAYLDMVRTVLAEREAMYYDTLDRHDSELVVTVFVQTDRISHMFWRGIDPEHPLYAETSAEGRGAIRWIYRQADRILGETLTRMKPNDRLIVLSDHGFANFRRVVHLNRWLIDQGYLRLKPGHREAGVGFAGVDWSRSRAYALGLNGIFLNLKGREADGTVAPEDAPALKREIQSRLSQLQDSKLGLPVIGKVFDGAEIYHGSETADAPDLVVGYREGFRASWQTVLGDAPKSLLDDNREKWSGDHCILPSAVPGVLFTSFQLPAPVRSIADIAQLALRELPGPATPVRWNDAPKRGLFDLANPLLDILRAPLAGWLPPFIQLLLWSLLGAYVSMALYRWLSNQSKLRVLKPEIVAARSALASYDGPFGGLWPLIGRNYRLAGMQMWLTFVPALLSSLPLLFLLAWISNHYDVRLPAPGERIELRAYATPGFRVPSMQWRGSQPPAPVDRGHWAVSWPEAGHQLALTEHDGTVLLSLPFDTAVDTVHQRLWWNRLFANPLGYLPRPGIIERIDTGLPRVEIIGFGPGWLRSWYFTFFAGLLAFSLVFKQRWKLR